jgi:hypothetical protein
MVGHTSTVTEKRWIIVLIHQMWLTHIDPREILLGRQSPGGGGARVSRDLQHRLSSKNSLIHQMNQPDLPLETGPIVNMGSLQDITTSNDGYQFT